MSLQLSVPLAATTPGEAESRILQAIQGTVRLRQRQLLVTRHSPLSELWAECAELLADLKANQDTLYEYRHAVGHWCTVFERQYGGEPSLGFCEEHPEVLGLFQEGLALYPSRWWKKRADACETISTYTQRRTCRRIQGLFRLAGPADRHHKLYQHALGVLESPPVFPESVAVSPGVVRALDVAELGELLRWLCEANAADIRRPKLPGVAAWRFWRAYVLTAVYEGLRPAELFRLEWRHIKRGRIEADKQVNRKQGRWISRRLHPVCAAELEAIRPGMESRKYVFRWSGNLRYCERIAAGVLSQAIAAETWQLGKGLYVLRKTHLTQLECLRTGAAQMSAGHSSGKITTDSYLDPRQTDADIDRLPDYLELSKE